MNISRKTLWIVLVLIVAAGGYIGISTMWKGKSANSEKHIVIGAALGLTGDAATWGEASLNGAQIAVDEINAAGGIDGRPVRLAVEDMKSDSKGAVLAVSKLQDIDKADALISTWLDVYQGYESNINKGTILISPDAGIEAVNKPSVHSGVFSTWYRTQPKSELAVQHMKANGKKKLYLLVQNDSYYATVSDFMQQAAATQGIEIVGKDMLTPDSDIKAILPKISQSGADAVFFAFYDEKLNTEFLKRRMGVLDKVAIYGDEFIQQNYSRSDYNPAWFEGVYFYTPRKADQRFFDAYVARYGKEPVFGASTTYDAVHMIAKALADRPENIDEYMRTTTFKTVSYGDVSFDEIGGVKAPENYFTIKQIKEGQAVEAAR